MNVVLQVGENVLFFTTDGAGADYLINGVIPGVFPTVDFGCGSDSEAAFRLQRRFLPGGGGEGGGGPPVNSEFYPGWLDHWESPHSKVDKTCIVNSLGRTPPSPLLSSLASLVRQDAEPGSKCQYLLGIRGNFVRLHCWLKLGPFPGNPNLL